MANVASGWSVVCFAKDSVEGLSQTVTCPPSTTILGSGATPRPGPGVGRDKCE
jgi:hypothetical protein